MNANDVRDAMGRRDGDIIELSNQWAKVIIERRCCGDSGPLAFVVSGDLADTRESEKSFTSLPKAMAYALASLAAYEQGALR